MAAVMVRSRGAPSRTRRAAGSSRARRHGPQVACVGCRDAAEGRTHRSARQRAEPGGRAGRASRRTPSGSDYRIDAVPSCLVQHEVVSAYVVDVVLRLVR